MLYFSILLQRTFSLEKPRLRAVGIRCTDPQRLALLLFILFIYLVCETVGTAATPGLLCQPRVIVKMIVEKQMGM
jgi:hypothetical protein